MTALQEQDDEVRWAQAESILAGSPTPDARRRALHVRTRLWVLVASLLVLSAAVGLGVALVTDAGSGEASEPSTGWVVAGFVCFGLSVLVVVVGIVLMVRRGTWRAAWRAPVSVLTFRQRRQLTRQVLGRAPFDVRRLALARDLAVRVVDQRGLLVVYAGVPLNAVGQALGDPAWSRAVWAVGFVLFYGVLVLLVERQTRRARRFLARHQAL